MKGPAPFPEPSGGRAGVSPTPGGEKRRRGGGVRHSPASPGGWRDEGGPEGLADLEVWRKRGSADWRNGWSDGWWEGFRVEGLEGMRDGGLKR